ncbi:MAG: hypothetical protein FD137_926 [Spirochaetes bacterium]|nr:MAG: hypothetical protein FD137_926 [Spirochaetota bacterium]
MIFWNAELARRLACSKREKSHLGSIIKELLEIHDTVRTEGIKSLTDSASIKEKPILSYGLRLIEEGVSGETLEEILAIYLIASPWSGFDFLLQCLHTEALLSLAAGDSKDMYLRKLVPYCGVESAADVLGALEL